ncbi:hypothetical protein LY78DRAFT_380126 [Colletotrichum sublineola]|nr:hypothetical protein LY78DRAFT_380126 [Colletotrichum sublineola]
MRFGEREKGGFGKNGQRGFLYGPRAGVIHDAKTKREIPSPIPILLLSSRSGIRHHLLHEFDRTYLLMGGGHTTEVVRRECAREPTSTTFDDNDDDDNGGGGGAGPPGFRRRMD